MKGCTGEQHLDEPDLDLHHDDRVAVAVPTNGAIYSDVSVIVQGTVKGRVTVAAENQILIGNTLLYDGDGGSFATPSYGAERPRSGGEERGRSRPRGHRGTSTGARPCSHRTEPGREPEARATTTPMNHRGMAATEDGGGWSAMFDTRDYHYDDSLAVPAAAVVPDARPELPITAFRELPAG